MSGQKYKIGTNVFFYTLAGRLPGVIHDAMNENGIWYYEIRVGSYIVKNVMEHQIEIRNEFPEVKYKLKDVVRFTYIEKNIAKTAQGEIAIIDRWGTFGQDEEPSYDILVIEADGRKCLWKHIRQSAVLELIKEYQE